MTIKKPNGPFNGAEVIRQAIAIRFPAFAALGSPIGGAQDTAPPVPYYHLSLEALRDAAPLSRAEQTGWRFTVVNGTEISLARLSNAPSNGTPPTFQGLSKGLLAQRYVKAAHFAENQLGRAQTRTEYEPRLLDVPALHFVALWLKGSRDLFIPLLEGASKEPEEMTLVSDIVPDLRRKAAQRSQAPFAGDARPTPTN
jgi:hypothetical protein